MKKLPKLLVYVGTLPFLLFGVAVTAGVPFIPSSRADIIFLSYVALILSFIGGLNWGFLIQKVNFPRNSILFVWSVLLMLFSWGSLFIHFSPFAYLILAFLYAGEVFFERSYRTLYPPGYLSARNLPMLLSVSILLIVFFIKI